MPGNWKGSDRADRLPPDWQSIRRQVLRRDKGVCQIRGPHCTVRAIEVDHKQHGDDHTLTNLQAACPTCHRTKSAREGVQARATIRARRYRPTPPHPGLRETP